MQVRHAGQRGPGETLGAAGRGAGFDARECAARVDVDAHVARPALGQQCLCGEVALHGVAIIGPCSMRYGSTRISPPCAKARLRRAARRRARGRGRPHRLGRQARGAVRAGRARRARGSRRAGSVDHARARRLPHACRVRRRPRGRVRAAARGRELRGDRARRRRHRLHRARDARGERGRAGGHCGQAPAPVAARRRDRGRDQVRLRARARGRAAHAARRAAARRAPAAHGAHHLPRRARAAAGVRRPSPTTTSTWSASA